MKRKYFNFIAYCDYDFLVNTLSAKVNQISSSAFIYHDKDFYISDVMREGELLHSAGELKTPHFHIYLELKSWRYVKDIKKWFVTEDSNGLPTSVLYRDMKGTPLDCILYLTHENAPDKYQYSRDEIVSYNIDWQDLEKYNLNDAPVDNCFDIINDMLNNVDLLTLIKRYGRDFVYHYQSFSILSKQIIDNSANDTNNFDN